MAFTRRSKMAVGFLDRSGEKSRTEMYLVPLAAGGANQAAIVTSHDNVKAAIAVVTLCNYTTSTVEHGFDPDVPTLPASPNAQREIGLWVQYVDVVNSKYYSLTIPGPDLTLLAQANTDEVDIAANATAVALILVLEAELRSELGNAIQVTRMRIIGRRN